MTTEEFDVPEPPPRTELPPLAEFLRWLNDMPAVFRNVPAGFPGGKTPVHAVVADLYETLSGEPPAADLLQAFRPASTAKAERNRLYWVLAACHMLWHPALRTRPAPVPRVRQFLVQELAALAAVVPSNACSMTKSGAKS